MQYSIQALAELVGGTVKGDGKVLISGARPITDAAAGDITFVEDGRNARLLQQSQASAAVVAADFQSWGLPMICVANPLDAFVTIFEHLRGPRRQVPPNIHPQASIAASARLGRNPSVSPFVVIGEDVTIGDRCRLMAGAIVGDGCRLGDDVVLHPQVVLYPDTVLGNRVIVQAGAVLGADGFGYRHQAGRHVKMPQLGHVELGDDVEIGANTTIDRGTFHVTRVGEGTKIDNLVQIAHNCQIGRHNLIIGQAGIAGSCKTGDYVIIAGQAGIKDHITIGEGAILGAMAGVMRDVPAGEKWLGIPATTERELFRQQVNIQRLPEVRKQLHAVVERVEQLENDLRAKRISA